MDRPTLEAESLRIRLHSSISASSIRWADAAPQHTRSHRQSHLPTREMFDIPDEAPRFTLRDDRLNPGLMGCNANPSNF